MIYLYEKKFIAVILIVGIIVNFISIPTTVHASQSSNEIEILLNGSKLDLDVKPTVVYGRTYVPIRAILEDLDMTVTWDQTSQTVIGEKDGDVIKLALNGHWPIKSTYNGVPFYNDGAPNMILNGRTLVSVRGIATVLGLDVRWDKFNRTVILKDSIKPNINLKQAYDILNNKSLLSSSTINNEYELFTLGGYAAGDNYALDNYYIFGVHNSYVYTDEYGNSAEDYITWDSNYCVNKHTGEVKVYCPELHFDNDYAETE